MLFRVAKMSALPSFGLLYRPNEYSFDVSPKPPGGATSLLVNDLQLELNSDGRVIYVWGLCPHTTWAVATLRQPSGRPGGLIAAIPNGLTPGVSVRITAERLPVFVDRQTGWVRLGRSEGGSEAVEISPGFVAQLLHGHLVALWLHPETLP